MKTNTQDNRHRVLQVASEIIGCKGFSAVGLNEILTASGIPKGSFYHYFASKEDFGAAMLEDYFSNYLANLEMLMAQPLSSKEKLMSYWLGWLDTGEGDIPKGHKCLAVKLGAEVSDLSVTMREVLHRGTGNIVKQLAKMVEGMIAEGDLLSPPEGIVDFAQALYQLWLGASLMGKMTNNAEPLQVALQLTQRLLQR
ncbi:TetR/AcrR family transcriptional regulator [Rahnella sp. SAP-1]|uniref:TetR/AcrR family transcriptional regulator n=1 Tax=Rouxiella aceris TaxID=2703884 RepID=A0A848MQC7_9GAMM|nr:TetR/AcrR family transcriptional regulator [Rouxiella aceris]NMP29346.1 TetR/AcrR family transcriptional regulator [Rouxiella aceris]